MCELSIIIPGVQEYPQVLFTIRSVYEELRDRADFEIIYVDNWCPEAEAQGKCSEPDGVVDHLRSVQRGWPWLKVMEYKEKLSHWSAKRVAVETTTSTFIMFLDAHVIPSRNAIFEQLEYYRKHHARLDGPLHLPTTYQVCEYHALKYKLTADLDKGHVHYSFTGYSPPIDKQPFVTPCHTTDGMMITRELYDELGGVPVEMGIWGGCENHLNFTLAVLGKRVWVMGNGLTLNHHGAKRGYNYNYDDLYRNRAIAAFIYGGEDFVRLMTDHYKGNQRHLHEICSEVIEKCRDQERMIRSKQVISIEDWVLRWTNGKRKTE